jgi:hypothetical protein
MFASEYKLVRTFHQIKNMFASIKKLVWTCPQIKNMFACTYKLVLGKNMFASKKLELFIERQQLLVMFIKCQAYKAV